MHTLKNLPSTITKTIQYVNKYSVNPTYAFNQPGNGGVCANGKSLNLGVHRLGLLPVSTANERKVKRELNQNKFGLTKWYNLEVYSASQSWTIQWDFTNIHTDYNNMYIEEYIGHLSNNTYSLSTHYFKTQLIEPKGTKQNIKTK